MSDSQFEIDSNTDQNPTLLVRASVPAEASDALDMTVLASFAEVQGEDEPDIIVELIDLYLADTPHRVSAIQAALAARDGLALKRAAHTLKGSSANLGAHRLAALCAELEQLTEGELAQGCAALQMPLAQEFARVRQAFAAERQRRSAGVCRA